MEAAPAPKLINLPYTWSKKPIKGSDKAVEGNLLGGNTIIEIDSTKIDIPLINPTNLGLKYYGAVLLSEGDIVQFQTYKILPIFRTAIGKTYSSDYLQGLQFHA